MPPSGRRVSAETPCEPIHEPLTRGNALICRVAGLDWRLDRVYFLAFLNPSQGQPDPALTARLASPATVDEPTTELD
jgi:hypothetical protein